MDRSFSAAVVSTAVVAKYDGFLGVTLVREGRA